MSELLNSLNGTAPDKSFSDELAAASAAFEAEQPKPESGMEAATEPTPDMRLSGIPSEDDEVAPPQKGDVQESPAPPEKQDRTVPLKALQEERQKRAELERRIAMLEGRVQQQPQETEQEEEVPDPETDPIGALKYTRQKLDEMRQQSEQQAYIQQLNQIASRAEAEFSQTTPDYIPARNFLRQGRIKELQMFGVPGEQIPVIIANEERQLVQAALQQRRNPAEVVYEIAKARGHGVQAAPPPVVAAPDPVAKTELQAAKQAVAPSVSSGGKPPKGELTPEALLNLNGAAFDAAWNKMFKGNKSSLFRD
jgi:hypothetical protein